MRRRIVAMVVGIAVVVALAFFFAPVVYWFSAGPYYEAYPHYSPQVTPVFRSLGCIAVGYGLSYGPDWFGLVIGCGPGEWPFPQEV